MPSVEINSYTHFKNSRIFIDKKHFSALINMLNEQLVNLDKQHLENLSIPEQIELLFKNVVEPSNGGWFVKFDNEGHITDLDFEGDYVWYDADELDLFLEVICPYVSHGNHMIINNTDRDSSAKVIFKNGKFKSYLAEIFFNAEEEILQLLINKYGIDSTLGNIQNSILLKEAVEG